jgi:glycosyltransferase involved in cell wall biosynthesis
MDGVLQSSFIRWGDERVCEDCGWYRVPIVCCDEKNDYWGKVRNELADFQVTTGGNRVDYNDDPRVHEVPEFYCMDPELWNPDLLVPTNYRIALPVDCVKILHAVGNFDKRTSAKEKRNIKSTHIYLALMDELKAEGHNVELVFLKDVPNKQFRFYQAQVDIVVDMLTYGFFGANVREAMMMGKPCVCYLRQEWLETMRREVPEYVEELPVISATPASIKMILTDLIIHPEKRKEIGEKSREFAVKWHSADAGAKRMIQIYEELSNVTNSSSSRATRG